MTIANVALTDTFDVWRTKTNQLINVYDETNALARASYNATNSATVTAANLAANVLVSNTLILGFISNTVNITTNSIAPNIILSNTTIINTIYNYSNTITYGFLSNANITLAWNKANSAYDIANAAFEVANTANAGGGGVGIGGYYEGNDGRVGSQNTVGNIFRITTPYLNNNVSFATAENAFAVGPIYMADDTTFTINTGARVVII